MVKDTVCAIVVTYNRKKLLMECLDALKKQSYPLNAIYLIDNSSNDGTIDLLLEKGYIEELPPLNSHEIWEKSFKITNSKHQKEIDFYYVRMYENTGGSGAFYEGVKRAYNDGYQWLWIMDDDAEPQKDALYELANYFDEKNISALAGLVKTPETKIDAGHRGFRDFISFPTYTIRPINEDSINKHPLLKIDHASFVGILVNRKAVSQIGFPKKEFFIYADDTEYSIRLRTVGEILLITDSIILHKKIESNLEKKRFLGRTFLRIKYENLWLLYYEIRNNIWILHEYRKPKIYFWIMLIRSWLISIFAVIILDNNKLNRINLITSAYKDGVNSNFDNEKPKKILYSNKFLS